MFLLPRVLGSYFSIINFTDPIRSHHVEPILFYRQLESLPKRFLFPSVLHWVFFIFMGMHFIRITRFDGNMVNNERRVNSSDQSAAHMVQCVWGVNSIVVYSYNRQ